MDSEIEGNNNNHIKRILIQDLISGDGVEERMTFFLQEADGNKVSYVCMSDVNNTLIRTRNSPKGSVMLDTFFKDFHQLWSKI